MNFLDFSKVFQKSLLKFGSSLNFFKLKFLCNEIEEMYQNNKSPNKDYNKFLDSYMGVAFLIIHLKILVTSIIIFYTNGLNIYEIFLLVFLVLTLIGYGVEIILYFFFTKSSLRTAFINILTFFLIIFSSIVQWNRNMVYSCDMFSIISTSIFLWNIILLYTRESIPKMVFISIDFIIVLVFFSLYSEQNILIKIFNYLMIVIIYISCLLISYIVEYQNRYLFFLIYNQYKARLKMEKFFNNIKIPLIKTSKGKVKLLNKEFKKQILKIGTKNQGKLSQEETTKFLKKITNDSSHKSLHHIIKNQNLIEPENLFTIDQSQTEKVTINSTSLKSFNSKQIIYTFYSNQSEQELIDLRKKIQSMKSYLASVSHDFKTPLSLIIHTSNSLLTIQDIPLEIIKELNLIKDTAEFILFNVQDIMDYSRISNKSLKMCPLAFNFKEVISKACIALSNALSKDNVVFDMYIDNQIPDIIISDANRIKQIIMNLMSNAFKFTIEGQVTVKIVLESNNKIRISVSDTGIGIKEENIQKLFKEFSTLDDPLHLNPLGVGLGLSIVKILSCLLGGDVFVYSKLNQGTTFQFNFQFEKVESKNSSFSPTPPKLQKGFSNIRVTKCDYPPMFPEASKSGKLSSHIVHETNIVNENITKLLVKQTKSDCNVKKIKSFNIIPSPNIERVQKVNSENEGINSFFAPDKSKENNISQIYEEPNEFLSSRNFLKKIPEKNELLSPINQLAVCDCSIALVVDDQAYSRTPICYYCKSNNIKYEEAPNGEIAVQKVIEKSIQACCKVFHYIFMDFNMPILDGYQAAIKIREYEIKINQGFSKIIGLSGNPDDFDRVDNKNYPNLFWKTCQKPLDSITFNQIIHGDVYLAQSKNCIVKHG